MGSGDAGDVGQVLHLGQRALVRRLCAAGHGGRARGRAGRAVRAQARQEERARAHRHRVRVLRVAGCHHALALLRVLLGAQGRAVCATQGGGNTTVNGEIIQSTPENITGGFPEDIVTDSSVGPTVDTSLPDTTSSGLHNGTSEMSTLNVTDSIT